MLSIIFYHVPYLKLLPLRQLALDVLDKEGQSDQHNILTLVHDLFTIQIAL
jgi:hypothetical protein